MVSLGFLLVALVHLGLSSAYMGNYHCQNGRDVFVHLFEWRWDDIRNDCQKLANMGYCGVQVSPPQEHIQGSEWWTRYQPVSYGLNSRSGNENQFRNMVEHCNNVGVRIYVDAIINHMTGGGSGTGSGGSSWNGNTESYPAVPYSGWDFHGNDVCHSPNMEIRASAYGNNANEVRYCRLVGLRDLRHDNAYVKDKTVEYMNKLVNMGVAGFRIDAAKHMFPSWIQDVVTRLNNLPTRWFPGGTRPFIFTEVIDLGGEAVRASEYLYIARSTEFKYSAELGYAVRGANGQRLAYLNNFGESWGFMSGMSAVVFTDNHDNQRGHGAGGEHVLTYKNSKLYKVGNAYMLAWPYGYPKVMSSYDFNNGDQGPPGGGVNCFNGNWICEHEWRQIYNMVKFHNAVVGTNVQNWWDNGNQRIAFSRGNRGFIAINNQGGNWQRDFNTNLPNGQYCDVITCENNRPPCGTTSDGCRAPITVSGGWATINIPDDANPIVALHV